MNSKVSFDLYTPTRTTNHYTACGLLAIVRPDANTTCCNDNIVPFHLLHTYIYFSGSYEIIRINN